MFVNMTPHVLNILTGSTNNNGVTLTLPPSGQSIRVAQSFDPVGVFDEVTLYQAAYGAVETIDNATKKIASHFFFPNGLPEPVEGTIYVVSGQALEAIKALGRVDFAAPGELARDANGQPVGCNGLKV